MAFATFKWWECPECGSLGQVGPSVEVVICSGGGKRDPFYPTGRWDMKLEPPHEPTRCVQVNPPPGKDGALVATG